MSDTKIKPVRSTSGHPVTRTVGVLVACLSALLSLWLGPVTPAVADGPTPTPTATPTPLPTPSSIPSPTPTPTSLPTPTARDRLTLSAYDFLSEVPAAVVAGSSGNNLRVDLVAGEPLVDGTVVVALPRREWPTDLHPAGGLKENDPDLSGSFVVRPVLPEFPPGAGDCRGTAAAPVTVTVVNTPRQHLGVVQHLSCAMGDHISLRIVGVRAPRSVGVHTVGVSVSDASGRRGPSALGIRVVRRPTTRLGVDVPAQVTIYASTPVLVRALRPDGRVDTRARGWVRLTGPGGNDCIFQGGGPVLLELTAADAGVKVVDVTFQVLGPQRIEALSSSRRARPGESNLFQLTGQPHGAVCSVSYH